MVNVVAEMGEVGLPGLYLRQVREALLNAQVRRVRAVAEAVEYHHVNPMKLPDGRFGQTRAIRDIPSPRAAMFQQVSRHRRAMLNFQRRDVDIADGEWPVNRNEINLRTVQPDVRGLVVNIVEHMADVRQGILLRIRRQDTLVKRVEAADVVEPENVVRVRMREQYRMATLDLVIQHLLAEVGRRVNDEGRLVCADIEAAPPPPVTRVA